jgi:hypothetical protein
MDKILYMAAFYIPEVTMKYIVSWDVTPCILVGYYQHYERDVLEDSVILYMSFLIRATCS